MQFMYVQEWKKKRDQMVLLSDTRKEKTLGDHAHHVCAIHIIIVISPLSHMTQPWLV